MEKNIKKACDSGTDSSNMDTSYVADIKKKRDSGKTEGQAVLEWFEENARKNKKK